MTPLVDRDVEIPVIVFVGMGTSNGWVTSLDGCRTVFLAAELIPDPAMGAVLAAHELTHALHHLANSGWDAGDYPVSALTFAEGLATHLSAVAVPGHRDDEYLWFDGSHQQWLTECDTSGRPGRQRCRLSWRSRAVGSLSAACSPFDPTTTQEFRSLRLLRRAARGPAARPDPHHCPATETGSAHRGTARRGRTRPALVRCRTVHRSVR